MLILKLISQYSQIDQFLCFKYMKSYKKSFKMMQLESTISPQQIPSPLRILTLTWNMYGSIPPQRHLLKLFKSKQFLTQPDIIFIGTQQCEISLFWAFFWSSKPLWEQALTNHLKNYDLFATHTLQGLHNAVLISKTHNQQAKLISKKVLKAGFCCNLFGNKGAVSIKIKIYGQYIQFINCHLAPHQDNTSHRNQALLRIIDELACSNPSTQLILLGDMNYRLQLKTSQYIKLITKNRNTQQYMNYSSMFNIQQLTNQSILKDSFFTSFQQGKIAFPPTYKMNTESQEYSRKRVPGWTDRIFARKGKLKRNTYDCLYKAYGTDHRPVLALFQLDLEEGLSMFQDEQFQKANCQIF